MGCILTAFIICQGHPGIYKSRIPTLQLWWGQFWESHRASLIHNLESSVSEHFIFVSPSMKCTAVQERKLTQILLHTSCQWKVADNLSLLRKRKKEVKKRNKTEKKPKIGKISTQTPSNHFQYRMHCNYQISNRDLLTAGYHPKLMKKCNFWPWAPKKIVVSFEQFELLAAAIHFLAGQQEPRQFIVYLVCNESLVSSHHFAHMHLFKKVVDTSFLEG